QLSICCPTTLLPPFDIDMSMLALESLSNGVLTSIILPDRTPSIARILSLSWRERSSLQILSSPYPHTIMLKRLVRNRRGLAAPGIRAVRLVRSTGGFTFLEIMIVVLVIALLAALILARFTDAKDEA